MNLSITSFQQCRRLFLQSSRRAQAMTEMIFCLPLILLCFVALTHILPILDYKQRATMATWYVLRGESVDSHHRSSTSFREDVAQKMFPDLSSHQVQVSVSDDFDWLAGPLQILDVVSWYVIPKDKSVQISLTQIPYASPSAIQTFFSTEGASLNENQITLQAKKGKMLFNCVNPP